MSLSIRRHQLFTAAVLLDCQADTAKSEIVYYTLFFRSKTFFSLGLLGKLLISCHSVKCLTFIMWAVITRPINDIIPFKLLRQRAKRISCSHFRRLLTSQTYPCRCTRTSKIISIQMTELGRCFSTIVILIYELCSTFLALNGPPKQPTPSFQDVYFLARLLSL